MTMMMANFVRKKKTTDFFAIDLFYHQTKNKNKQIGIPGDEQLKDDSREHLNIVFVGHVDAGNLSVFMIQTLF